MLSLSYYEIGQYRSDTHDGYCYEKKFNDWQGRAPIPVAIPATRLRRNGSNTEAILLAHPSTRMISVDRMQTQFKRSPSVEARAGSAVTFPQNRDVYLIPIIPSTGYSGRVPFLARASSRAFTSFFGAFLRSRGIISRKERTAMYNHAKEYPYCITM